MLFRNDQLQGNGVDGMAIALRRHRSDLHHVSAFIAALYFFSEVTDSASLNDLSSVQGTTLLKSSLSEGLVAVKALRWALVKSDVTWPVWSRRTWRPFASHSRLAALVSNRDMSLRVHVTLLCLLGVASAAQPMGPSAPSLPQNWPSFLTCSPQENYSARSARPSKTLSTERLRLQSRTRGPILDSLNK